MAHNYIKGELVVIVDSDDYLLQDAIETIGREWKKYRNQDDICGISYCRGYDDELYISVKTGEDFYVSDDITCRVNNSKIKGDRCEVVRTDLFKKYPFPVFEGENFLSEEIVWNRIARDGYKFRWFNEGLYFCEYLEDGLSKTSNKELNNFNGYKLVINELLTYKEIPFKRKVISLMIIGEISLRKKAKLKDVAKDINVNIFVFAVAAYLGKIIRKIRRWRRKNEES